jgi:hypothetical protein
MLPLEAKMEVSVTRNNHAQSYLRGMSTGTGKNLAENMQEAFQIRRPLADDDPGCSPERHYVAGRTRCLT